MRPKSHFIVDQTNPEARAVCDRCGQMWQLRELDWQFQWVATKLQNLRLSVCPPCMDVPQPQLKLIIIPPDPVPVLNPRPEHYSTDNNPLSPIGVSPNFLTPTYGSRIGTLTGAGGLNAAFDGTRVKASWQSASQLQATINSSYGGYVGVNWQGELYPNSALPSDLQSPVLTHSLSSVSIYAPFDRSFLGSTPTTYVVQCSNTNTSIFGAWTTIVSGTTAGTAGESIGVTITSTMTNPLTQFHRVAFLGNGTDYVSVAQAQFSVNEVEAT